MSERKTYTCIGCDNVCVVSGYDVPTPTECPLAKKNVAEWEEFVEMCKPVATQKRNVWLVSIELAIILGATAIVAFMFYLMAKGVAL